MGVADAMATYPELMETFFVAGKQAPLSGGNQTIIIQLPQYNYQYLHITVSFAEKIKNLFSKIHFSDAGSNE